MDFGIRFAEEYNEFKGRHELYITLIPDSDTEVKVTHLIFQ